MYIYIRINEVFKFLIPFLIISSMFLKQGYKLMVKKYRAIQRTSDGVDSNGKHSINGMLDEFDARLEKL